MCRRPRQPTRGMPYNKTHNVGQGFIPCRIPCLGQYGVAARQAACLWCAYDTRTHSASPRGLPIVPCRFGYGMHATSASSVCRCRLVLGKHCSIAGIDKVHPYTHVRLLFDAGSCTSSSFHFRGKRRSGFCWSMEGIDDKIGLAAGIARFVVATPVLRSCAARR